MEKWNQIQFESHFNLQQIKEPKFIVANIILQSQPDRAVCCLQNGYGSSLQESRTLKLFPKLHKYFTLKLSTLFSVRSQITNGRECFQVQFCNAIRQDNNKHYCFTKVASAVSRKLCACHEMWSNGALGAETFQNLILGKIFFQCIVIKENSHI